MSTILLKNNRPQEFVDPADYTPFFPRARPGREAGSVTHLACERVALEQVAEFAGTPTYVYSRGAIEAAYRELDGALGRWPHTLCYAVKANSNLAVLRVLARLGSGFDVVSGGELDRLRRIGVQGRRIVFSGVGKTKEEIREALQFPSKRGGTSTRRGILLFNVESEAEYEVLAGEAARHIAAGGRAPSLAVRVNPDVQAGAHPHISTGYHHHKFGLDWRAARRLYLAQRRTRWTEWRGISAHIGSQIVTLAPFRRALSRVTQYVRELQREGIRLDYLDFGGGLGIRYTHEAAPARREYAGALTAVVKTLGCHLLLEPGRTIVGPAGVLLTRVLYTKENRGKTFVIVDAAMNDLIRPALYGAVHPITKVVNTSNAQATKTVDVVGPVCETGDCLIHDWPLGDVRPGELLAIWGAGAYGFVQASNYNARPRAAEVLVEGNRFRVIRRRESRDDLVHGETRG
ncbi:MAG TPA: diaminopimelate decarboxylase [Candidatus Dormibacteraeota bacterium]|nr:diaminopimelate decarboxylase [Candidatus Dormibacteraeota bacterium]